MGSVEQRHAQILESLNTLGKTEVTVLSRQCQVSLATIRKDLTDLEERGLLRREQGAAVLIEDNDMRRRLAANYATKQMIIKEAAKLVSDGESVMIESGSCCILLAEEISKSKKNVTIITNSVFMAEYIGKNANIHLVLLGGDYQMDSQAVVGPVTKMGARLFHVNKIFAGTDGYLSGSGFTGDNHLRVETIRQMAENAEQVVVITESVKFARQGLVPLFSLTETDYLITDGQLPREVRAELETNHVTVIEAEQEGA